MVDRTGERRVAAHVQDLTAKLDGRRLGEPTQHDGQCRCGLQVDFTFDNPVSGPPIALEISSIHDDEMMGTRARLYSTERELQRVADEKGLGGWFITVDGRAHMKSLTPIILDVLRSGVDVDVDPYATTETGQDPASVHRHQAWHASGLRTAVRRQDGVGLIRLAAITSGRGIDGFTDLLQDVVDNNVAKLADARPRTAGHRETHLAVEVHRPDCATFPDRTAPPDMRGQVDVLWVFFRWAIAYVDPPIWRSRAGGDGWQLLTSPEEV